jgi:hypothetical protein
VAGVTPSIFVTDIAAPTFVMPLAFIVVIVVIIIFV